MIYLCKKCCDSLGARFFGSAENQVGRKCCSGCGDYRADPLAIFDAMPPPIQSPVSVKVTPEEKIARLKEFIGSDALAITFQSLGQYRTELLRIISDDTPSLYDQARNQMLLEELLRNGTPCKQS